MITRQWDLFTLGPRAISPLKFWFKSNWKVWNLVLKGLKTCRMWYYYLVTLGGRMQQVFLRWNVFFFLQSLNCPKPVCAFHKVKVVSLCTVLENQWMVHSVGGLTQFIRPVCFYYCGSSWCLYIFTRGGCMTKPRGARSFFFFTALMCFQGNSNRVYTLQVRL